MPLILFAPQPDPTYPLFPVFSFLGFVLALIPLSWHLQAWNAGTCIYMLWAGLASLVEFVDSVVWYGSLKDVAPVWCDISTKFLIGAGVGIPASSLCIVRRLYKITSVSSVSVTRKEKLKAVYVDIAIAIGIPIIVMCLHYIVQGHRYNIIENIGCTPDIYNTVPAYPLVFMWPVLLGCITFVYAALTLRTFYIHRIRFNQVVASNSSLTVSRYLRLIMLCCTEMALVAPLSGFSIYINTAGLQIQPWISWENTHYNFSFVELFPTFVWHAKLASHIAIEMGRWIYPCSAIMFFMLFGFAEEARRCYSTAFWRVAKVFGIQPKAQKTGKAAGFQKTFRMPESPSRGESLPPYAPRSKTTDSCTSFANSDIEKGTNPPQLILQHIVSPTNSMFDDSTDIELSPGPFETQYEPYDPAHDTDSQYAESTARIFVSDAAHPPLPTPPSPVPFRALSPPSYHRPFSPPVAHCRSTESRESVPHRKGSASSITIMVHTESRTF
ncbi:putative fungal pheromone GPCR, STE3-type [Epithele typhae]|uniref:putative fungal pheromone GPCR, STE3-type n=1 Tax=Epithele typhae TaxID=378194 RepID=UPI00200747D1|nr:putative fungal pheromone GPCR, STE3-type [Epithele typhae]KAH9916388.1 putative fungal pheromone GPCR, STE3-type [Epithele typhae]